MHAERTGERVGEVHLEPDERAPPARVLERVRFAALLVGAPGELAARADAIERAGRSGRAATRDQQA